MRYKSRLVRLLTNRPLVLIGAGQLGSMSLKMWPQNLQKPVMFLDSEKTGLLGGIPILPIDEHLFSPKYVYVLAYFKERPKAISQLFEKINQEIITVYDIFEIFSPNEFGNGWYANVFDYFNIIRTQKLFFDSNSKVILKTTGQWKFKRKLSDALEIGDEAQKYNLDFLNPEGDTYDFVIDGGCHDLYLLKNSQRKNIFFKKYLAIDPDPKSPVNFDGSLIEEADDRVTIVRKGLVGKNLMRTLVWSGLLSARLVPLPSQKMANVQLITLSELIREFGISINDRILIKLHIEGLEFEVIEEFFDTVIGWRKIHFMINLSHNKQSLVFIPKLLSRYGYTLKLESHSLFGEGITLYARM